MAQPSLTVTTWRTLWPGEELRRRGHDVQIDTMDAAYSPDEPPAGGLSVLHLTPSIFGHEPWEQRFYTARERAGTFVLDIDDDWTHLIDLLVEEETW